MRTILTTSVSIPKLLATSLFGVLFCTVIPGLARAETPLKAQQPVLVSLIKGLNQDYFPLGETILGSEASETILEYGSGENDLARLRSYSTIIHEGYHGWEADNKSEWRATKYLIEEGLALEVEHHALFDSREMHPEIPIATQKAIFRYNPYIYGSVEIGSHVQGIYGLMEEWNAYLLGTKASLATEAWFLKQQGAKTGRELFDWYGTGYLMLPASSVLANHEFRLFIAWYLDFAKRNHPEVYQACMSHMQLRVAYTLIEQEFQAMEDLWMEKVDDFCTASEQWSTGRALIRNGYFTYQDEQGGSGQGVFTEERDFLLESLSEPRFANVLADFRLSWVDKTNWQEAF